MSPQEVSATAPATKILSFRAPSVKGLSIKNLKLPALSFRDMSLKTPALQSPKPAPVVDAPAAFARPKLASPRTRLTVLSAAVVGMAVLAVGGMAMGPPFEPVRMSSLNAVKTEGYPVFDRYGVHVGRIAGVENVDGRTIWLDVKLEDGNVARVASFRGFLDARNKEVGLVLTQDLLEQRAVDQANAAADEAAFKAALESSETPSSPDTSQPT